MACSTSDKTFGNSDYADNIKYECGVKLFDGKILKGAATTPSGLPADSIVFFVEFDDDLTEVDDDVFEYTPTAYGFAKYRVAGYRYTGVEGDE